MMSLRGPTLGVVDRRRYARCCATLLKEFQIRAVQAVCTAFGENAQTSRPIRSNHRWEIQAEAPISPGSTIISEYRSLNGASAGRPASITRLTTPITG